MPTPPTANLVTGYGVLGPPPRRRETGSGHWGERFFWVNTHDEDEALNASGTPQYGQAWSVAAPNLTVIERETKYIGGTNNTTTGVNGVTVVRCTYETPGFSGRLPPPFEGLSFLEYEFEEQTTTQHYDIRFDGTNFASPLANGDGVPRQSTQLIAAATYYRNPSTFNRAALMNVLDTLNAQEFRLPPFYGFNIRDTVAVRGARMLAPRIGVKGGKLEIVFRLLLKPDHRAYAQIENARGQAVLTQIIEQYREADFRPFFP